MGPKITLIPRELIREILYHLNDPHLLRNFLLSDKSLMSLWSNEKFLENWWNRSSLKSNKKDLILTTPSDLSFKDTIAKCRPKTRDELTSKTFLQLLLIYGRLLRINSNISEIMEKITSTRVRFIYFLSSPCSCNPEKYYRAKNLPLLRMTIVPDTNSLIFLEYFHFDVDKSRNIFRRKTAYFTLNNLRDVLIDVFSARNYVYTPGIFFKEIKSGYDYPNRSKKELTEAKPYTINYILMRYQDDSREIIPLNPTKNDHSSNTTKFPSVPSVPPVLRVEEVD
jgi:hypothetical protein